MHLLSTASLYWGDAEVGSGSARRTYDRSLRDQRSGGELMDHLRPKLSIKSNKSPGRSGKTRHFVVCWTRPPRFRIRSNNSTLAGAGVARSGAEAAQRGRRWLQGISHSRAAFA